MVVCVKIRRASKLFDIREVVMVCVKNRGGPFLGDNT